MGTLASAAVATDFSQEAGAAARRAALIAGETGLHGALLHVLPGSLPPAMHVLAAAQAQQALSAVAAELQGLGAAFEPRLLTGDIDAELARAVAGFDFAIAGARGGNLLLDFALGRTSVRLVRDNQRPTLIVRRAPEGPYRRVVAAVDFSEPSRAAVALGALIAPRADFDLVHAYEVQFESTLRFAGAEQAIVEAYRNDARVQAMEAMEAFARGLPIPGERILPVVMHGYPARVILDQAKRTGAELIVIGKHSAGVVERVLIASTALEVLEDADCDVLVVPQPSGSPTRPG